MVEVLSGPERRRPPQEKLPLVQQTMGTRYDRGVHVAPVCGINANQIFKWRANMKMVR